MTATTQYQPGVCNISPAEIRRRRATGWIGVVVTVAWLAVAFALNLPAGLAASGFLQAGMHFCARFGAVGIFNFGAVGTEENVMEAEFRAKDRRKAFLILGLSAGVAIVVAVAAFLIP